MEFLIGEMNCFLLAKDFSALFYTNHFSFIYFRKVLLNL